MIENIIYWVGVSAIACLSITVILLSFIVSQILITRHLTKELKSAYNHVQLYWVMNELKKKGYAQCVEDIGGCRSCDNGYDGTKGSGYQPCSCKSK